MKYKSTFNPVAFMLLFPIGLLSLQARANAADADPGEYLRAVERFADTVIERGRDTYGEHHTPLFVDGLHTRTLEPVVWKKDGQSWVLSNFAGQQPLMRLLDGLTAVTGKEKYRKSAEDATAYALKNLQSPSGLLYWGGHMAWDLQQDRQVGQYAGVHEMKNHRPYYRLMWRIDAPAAAALMEAVWAGHILDWARLDYNRHADASKKRPAPWNHPFDEDLEVPFPAQGGNLSFANVTPSLMHAGTMLAVLAEHKQALIWTRRLAMRWQQGEHPQTGLCGGQLSYRTDDRARDALGHVHPNINEAQIVASYHQTARYHDMPLTHMQDAEDMLRAGGDCAAVGRQLIEWAVEDLKTYARQCYDAETGRFIARMIDGTPLRWQEAKTGYYVPESFAPREPDGQLIWGYATAFRISKDNFHWQMLRQILSRRGLGDIGLPDGQERRIKFDTACTEWRLIYALLELHQATGHSDILKLACRIGDNLLKTQAVTGLFPRPNREYARTGDEIPLALLHLAAALANKSEKMPSPASDSSFFHCEYDGPLEEYQKKRADARTYDHMVFYGPS